MTVLNTPALFDQNDNEEPQRYVDDVTKQEDFCIKHDQMIPNMKISV